MLLVAAIIAAATTVELMTAMTTKMMTQMTMTMPARMHAMSVVYPSVPSTPSYAHARVLYHFVSVVKAWMLREITLV